MGSSPHSLICKSGIISGVTYSMNHQEVERLAYFLYVSRGRPEGQALQHWHEAENQLADYQHYSNADAGTTGYSASLRFSAEPQD